MYHTRTCTAITTKQSKVVGAAILHRAGAKHNITAAHVRAHALTCMPYGTRPPLPAMSDNKRQAVRLMYKHAVPPEGQRGGHRSKGTPRPQVATGVHMAAHSGVLGRPWFTTNNNNNTACVQLRPTQSSQYGSLV